jgi:hypothetical protein
MNEHLQQESIPLPSGVYMSNSYTGPDVEGAIDLHKDPTDEDIHPYRRDLLSETMPRVQDTNTEHRAYVPETPEPLRTAPDAAEETSAPDLAEGIPDGTFTIYADLDEEIPAPRDSGDRWSDWSTPPASPKSTVLGDARPEFGSEVPLAPAEVAAAIPGLEELDAEITRLRAQGIKPLVEQPTAKNTTVFKAPKTADETVDLADITAEDLRSDDAEAAATKPETSISERLRKLGRIATETAKGGKEAFTDNYQKAKAHYDEQRVIRTSGTPETRTGAKRRDTAKRLGHTAVQHGKRAAQAAAPHLDPRKPEGRRNLKRGAAGAVALGRMIRRRKP